MVKKSQTRKRERPAENWADWSEANSGHIHQLIYFVTKMGGAVRFGTSRDGGAYSIGIYGDGEPFTEYLSGSADIDEWLQGWIETYRE